jgi:hypothetical protein
MLAAIPVGVHVWCKDRAKIRLIDLTALLIGEKCAMIVAEDLGYSGKALEMKVCMPAYDSNSSALITISRYQIIMRLASSLELLLPDFEKHTVEGIKAKFLDEMMKRWLMRCFYSLGYFLPINAHSFVKYIKDYEIDCYN